MADKIKKVDPKEWQGRYCVECVYALYCTGAGVKKNACRGFEPRVRKDAEIGNKNGKSAEKLQK